MTTQRGEELTMKPVVVGEEPFASACVVQVYMYAEHLNRNPYSSTALYKEVSFAVLLRAHNKTRRILNIHGSIL